MRNQREIRTARSHPTVADASHARTRWAFLAEVSDQLAQSLDYETTVRAVADLSVPTLGSWSIVDLGEPDGSYRRLAVAHHDPEMQALARELESGWPPAREDPGGIPVVARTGSPELIGEITDELLTRMSGGDGDLRVLRQLAISSLMTVPMRSRDRIIGAMTFLSSSPHRRFNDADVSLAEDLARRCALAIDNAREYRDAIALVESEAARARAEAADEVKRRFLSMLSHELRTPLNGIAGYLELMAMEVAGPLTPDQRRYLDRIRSSERQLLTMVEDVLNFIRLYSGEEVRYEMADVPLRPMLDRLRETYGPAMEAKGIALEITCDPGLCAYADPGKLWQILFNLLSNARKYTETGGRVDLTAASDDGRVLITVRDTGCGIPEARLDSVFQPFTQADDPLNRRAGGVGLGLTISRELARGMGGDLDVTSVAEEGCTFSLRLQAPGGINYEL